MTRLDPFRLDGRRAFVTASSRGIGRAIALAFARAGAALCVHGGSGLSETQAVASQIRDEGGTAHALVADFANADAVIRCTADALAALGGIDILVSNAAVQVCEPWDALSPAAIDLQLQVNLKATLALMGRLVPAMAERGWGRVLTIGSVQEIRPNRAMIVYAATKAAQTSVVRTLAREVAGQGVTVNNLAPGVIVTDRNTEALADPAYAEAVKARIPAGCFGMPEDCAGAALLLCSDAGRYITGTSIVADGGMHL